MAGQIESVSPEQQARDRLAAIGFAEVERRMEAQRSRLQKILDQIYLAGLTVSNDDLVWIDHEHPLRPIQEERAAREKAEQERDGLRQSLQTQTEMTGFAQSDRAAAQRCCQEQERYIETLKQERDKLAAALERFGEELDDESDVEDGADGLYPNSAMRFSSRFEELLGERKKILAAHDSSICAPLEARIRELDAALSELLKATDHAPHARYCGSILTIEGKRGPCDCWRKQLDHVGDVAQKLLAKDGELRG